MHTNQIATRLSARPNPTPGDTPIDHPYRRRWWLPIIGPSATCLLDHLTRHHDHGWQIHDATELAISLGLGKGTGAHSPLIRTLDRLVTFGFAAYDIEPGSHSDPCLTLWTTSPLIAERQTRRWPEAMQHAHTEDLAALARALR